MRPAKTCKQGNDWLGIPVATIGGYMTYRKSAIDKAGFKAFPNDFPGFLEMCKALKKNNTPAGFALGHATGDANGWLHWVLVGSRRLYRRQERQGHHQLAGDREGAGILQGAFRHLYSRHGLVERWSNNKAFLAGDLYCTANGISIYVAAKDDPKMKDLADDTYHALWPVGPVGHPTELQLAVPILAFNFTKYPNAAKAFIAFMLEKDQFEKWLSGARGYLTHTLNAYDSAPVWTADPKNQVFSQASKRALPASGIGTPGEKAASCDRRLHRRRHVRQLLHRHQGRQGRDCRCRAAAEADLSLISTIGRAAAQAAVRPIDDMS